MSVLLTSKKLLKKYRPELLVVVISISTHTLMLVWGLIVAKDLVGTDLFSVWVRWDAVHYLNIAKYGYNPPHLDIQTIAFMSRFPPLYPLAIKFFSYSFSQNFALTSFLTSTIFIIASSLLLYKLVIFEGYSKNKAYWSVLFLNIFPTSYFLLAPYSEGLFIMLVLAYFYYARVKKAYLTSSVIFSAILITRVFGIFMYPVHLYFFIKKIKKDGLYLYSIIKNFLMLLLPLVMFIIYQLWVILVLQNQGYLKSNDPSSIKLGIPFYELFQSYSKILTDASILNNSDFMYTVGYTAVFMFFIIVLTLISISRIHISYIIYMLSFIFFVSCLRWVISGPRFALACFPLLIFLAAKTKIWQKLLVSVIFIALLLSFSHRYLIGWWAF